jgi:hypothetical protein
VASSTECGICHRDPAAGCAEINGVHYCHGDDAWVSFDDEPTLSNILAFLTSDEHSPTCYEMAQECATQSQPVSEVVAELRAKFL